MNSFHNNLVSSMSATVKRKLDHLSSHPVILESIHIGKPEGLCESENRGKV